MIERKNAEICELKRQNDKKMENLEAQRENEISEVRYLCDKEMNNLAKLLEGKDK